MVGELKSTKKTYDSSIEKLYEELFEIPQNTSSEARVEIEKQLRKAYFFNTEDVSTHEPYARNIIIEIGKLFNDETQLLNIEEVKNKLKENGLENISNLKEDLVKMVLEYLVTNNILEKNNGNYTKNTQKRSAKTVEQKCTTFQLENYLVFELAFEKIQSENSPSLEEMKSKLISKIIDDITHVSASSNSEQIKIRNIEVSSLIKVDKVFVPKYIYEKLMLKLPQIISQAFSNYYMYLSNNNVEFYDSYNRKYQFPINLIHVLGLKNELFETDQKIVERLSEIASKPEAEKNEILKKKDAPKFNLMNTLRTKKKGIKELNKNIKRIQQLDKEAPTSLEDRIKKLKEAQKALSQIMNDKRQSSQIEVLCWLLSSEEPSNINTDRIEEVIKNNSYRFSFEFKNLFDSSKTLTDKEQKQKNEIVSIVLSKINTPSIINSIKSKYEYLKEAQEYLMYLSTKYSLEIVTSVDKSKWKNEEYFGDKGKEGLGYFGLSKIVIEDVLENKYKQDESFNSSINLFKVFDKLNYLCNFNYVLDVNKIYITDFQKNEMSIICEMDALNELLLGYFESLNEEGIATFYSIENSEDKYTIPSKENDSEIILGLCKTDKLSNTITQTHKEAKKAYPTAEKLITALKDGKVILRYATSFAVKGNYSQDTTIQDKLDKLHYNKARVLTEYENLLINIEGIESTLEWVNDLTIDELKGFVGLEPTTKELQEIKLLFSIQLNKLFFSKQFFTKLKEEIEKINQTIIDKKRLGSNAMPYYNDSSMPYKDYSITELENMYRILVNKFESIASKYDIEYSYTGSIPIIVEDGNLPKTNHSGNIVEVLENTFTYDKETLLSKLIGYETSIESIPLSTLITLISKVGDVDENTLPEDRKKIYTTIKDTYNRKITEMYSSFEEELKYIINSNNRIIEKIRTLSGFNYNINVAIDEAIEIYRNQEKPILDKYKRKIDALVEASGEALDLIGNLYDELINCYMKQVVVSPIYQNGNYKLNNGNILNGNEEMLERNQEIQKNISKINCLISMLQSDLNPHVIVTLINTIQENFEMILIQMNQLKERYAEKKSYIKGESDITTYVDPISVEKTSSFLKFMDTEIYQLNALSISYNRILSVIVLLKNNDLNSYYSRNGLYTVEGLLSVLKDIPETLFNILYANIEQFSGVEEKELAISNETSKKISAPYFINCLKNIQTERLIFTKIQEIMPHLNQYMNSYGYVTVSQLTGNNYNELDEYSKLTLAGIIQKYINPLKQEIESIYQDDLELQNEFKKSACERIIGIDKRLSKLEPYIIQAFNINTNELEESGPKK